MIVNCALCNKFFEDEYRSVLCPHNPFLANDGQNNFAIHPTSYLSDKPPINGVER